MLVFETVKAKGLHPGAKKQIKRAKIVGGWLVCMGGFNGGMTFIPDPNHEWDGHSLP